MMPFGGATKLVMRKLRRIVLVAAMAVFSCSSPTLPLPPPALPSIALGVEASTFVLKSDKGALPNALIIIVNRDTTLANEDRVSGTIADNVGSWQATVKGTAGDVVDIAQDDGSNRSPTVTADLR